jgi:hypothetical protein
VLDLAYETVDIEHDLVANIATLEVIKGKTRDKVSLSLSLFPSSLLVLPSSPRFVLYRF